MEHAHCPFVSLARGGFCCPRPKASSGLAVGLVLVFDLGNALATLDDDDPMRLVGLLASKSITDRSNRREEGKKFIDRMFTYTFTTCPGPGKHTY